MTLIDNLIDDLVVLVDESGNPVGNTSRSDVHSQTTPLHLAFSLYLFDSAGHVLFTRRALGKATWPGVWTNSCCGHPRPGEAVADAVPRRLQQELGVSVTQLRSVLPDFRYSARDVTGICENEICPVFFGSVHPDEAIRPNREEVMDWVWADWADVRTAAMSAPFAFSPWAVQQISQLPTHP